MLLDGIVHHTWLHRLGPFTEQLSIGARKLHYIINSNTVSLIPWFHRTSHSELRAKSPHLVGAHQTLRSFHPAWPDRWGCWNVEAWTDNLYHLEQTECNIPSVSFNRSNNLVLQFILKLHIIHRTGVIIGSNKKNLYIWSSQIHQWSTPDSLHFHSKRSGSSSEPLTFSLNVFKLFMLPKPCPMQESAF